jgi:O-antigen ligase
MSSYADDRRWTGLSLAVPLVLAVVVPAAVVRSPVLALAGVVALVAGVFMLIRLDLAVLAFVAVSPFEDYANAFFGSAVKLVGLLVFAAWFLRLLVDRDRTRLRHPAVRTAWVLLLLATAATVLHTNEGGLVILSRYASFLLAFVVLVDVFRGALPARRAAAVYVVSCCAASAVSLVGFFAGTHYRAEGPLGDANDFAFFLAGGFMLALGLSRGRRRWLFAAALLLGTTFATLSRGAVVAILVAALWGLAKGHIKPRTAAASGALAAIAVVGVALFVPALISDKLQAKGKVAQANVDQRRIRWVAATEMAVDNPLLGLGPNGFNLSYDRYVDFRDPDPLHPLTVAHNLYLELAAELGVPALVAFLLMMYGGYAGADRVHAALPRSDPDKALAAGVQAGLVTLMVAAIFLTQQYYLPLWLFAAMGAGLQLRHPA